MWKAPWLLHSRYLCSAVGSFILVTVVTDHAPADKKREIRYLHFVHDGGLHEAEVGKRVTTRLYFRTGNRSKRQQLQPGVTYTGGTVKRIVAGTPYLVYTEPAEPSRWANPFMVGEGSIREIAYAES